ncbi:DUF6807 family protein [Micrococcus antarcticus]
MNQQATAAGSGTTSALAAPTAPAVVLIGLNGFGRQHLANIHRLAAEEKITFLAGIDPVDPGKEIRGKDTHVFADFDAFLSSGLTPDIIIISTPISTHADLAMRALRTGADLYLEKPPTATLDQYSRLLQAAADAGAHVQVGFQALGSTALKTIDGFFADNAKNSPIGALRAVGASGNWLRTTGYYERSPWAGHRKLDGVEIADGVVTNPLAHAVASALYIAGARKAQDVAHLATELYHAHSIEADDTSVVRVQTSTGIPVIAALTVCASEQQDPWITIYGTEGTATLYYTRDELLVRPNPDLGLPESSEVFGRVNLLENLVEVRNGSETELLSSLASAGAFMRVLEQIRTSDTPTQIAEEQVIPAGDGADFHPVIPNIERFIDRAVAAQSSFSSLGAPWALLAKTSGSLSLINPATGKQRTLAELRTGEDISRTNSPRPFLDNLKTFNGVVVSEQQPLDHTWHLGVGVALQDVNGTNFWGGRTYTRDASRYIWRADHGHIRTASNAFARNGNALDSQLEWVSHEQEILLDEHRSIELNAFEDHESAITGWSLDFSFRLSARERQVSLGSPGTNGRHNGGYGGFFWRLPPIADPQIFTPSATGESQVHGVHSPWLAFSATFSSDSVALADLAEGHGDATIIFCSEHDDPWFVRSSGYPGVGSSLAWSTPVVLDPQEAITRQVRVLVVDGRVPVQTVALLARKYGSGSKEG